MKTMDREVKMCLARSMQTVPNETNCTGYVWLSAVMFGDVFSNRANGGPQFTCCVLSCILLWWVMREEEEPTEEMLLTSGCGENEPQLTTNPEQDIKHITDPSTILCCEKNHWQAYKKTGEMPNVNTVRNMFSNGNFSRSNSLALLLTYE